MQNSLTQDAQDDLTDDQRVFLFNKYSCSASFQINSEAWVASEEFGMGEKKAPTFVRADGKYGRGRATCSAAAW